MTAAGPITKNTVRASTDAPTATSMKANGVRTASGDKALSDGPMETSMLVNGATANDTAMANLLLLITISMRVSGKTIRRMVEVSDSMLTRNAMKACFRMT